MAADKPTAGIRLRRGRLTKHVHLRGAAGHKDTIPTLAEGASLIGKDQGGLVDLLFLYLKIRQIQGG